ncbi:hypothetical protein RUR49_22650 [Pseudoxanthobacter sp. M-2]
MPHMDKVTKLGFTLEATGECSDEQQSSSLPHPGVIFSNNGSHHGGIADTIYTIEAEVIPRLLISTRASAPRTRSSVPIPQLKVAPRLETEVQILTQIVLLDEAHAAYSFVSSMRARGVGLESIFLDLLAPTARNLGEMWTADRCSFSEVTLGLCRLQQVLRQLSTVFDEEPEPVPSVSSVLLTPNSRRAAHLRPVDARGVLSARWLGHGAVDARRRARDLRCCFAGLVLRRRHIGQLQLFAGRAPCPDQRHAALVAQCRYRDPGRGTGVRG